MPNLGHGQPDRLIAERERRQITGMSRVHWWRMERARKCPLRLSLGPKTVRWRLSEVMAWMDALTPVEGSPKPIPKSANLRPRTNKRAIIEAKDRAALAESEARPKKSRRRVRASSNAQPTAAE
jgi:prophage regulatory protein